VRHRLLAERTQNATTLKRRHNAPRFVYHLCTKFALLGRS